MKQELCKEYLPELVESARHSSWPEARVMAHFETCEGCRKRWEAETRLTEQLGVLRAQAGLRQRPEARKQELMRRFEETRPARVVAFPRARRWSWVLAAAAAVVLAVGIGRELRFRSGTTAPVSLGQIAQISTDAVSTDAGALSAEDFVAVPFVPPLASGELVRIVHEDLGPQELARMGLPLDPAWTGDVAADVVVGEDGYPRAVRIADSGNE